MFDIILFVLIMVIMFFLFRAIGLYQQSKNKKKKKWDLSKLLIVTVCSKCNKRMQKKYRQGYFVGKVISKCKCGGNIIIEKIYSDRKTKKQKKWEKYISIFR